MRLRLSPVPVWQGELRPQLLDRFGLSVNVATIPDTDTRARMVMDRLEYEADPDGFAASVEPEQQALRDKLTAATARLKEVIPACHTRWYNGGSTCRNRLQNSVCSRGGSWLCVNLTCRCMPLVFISEQRRPLCVAVPQTHWAAPSVVTLRRRWTARATSS